MLMNSEKKNDKENKALYLVSEKQYFYTGKGQELGGLEGKKEKKCDGQIRFLSHHIFLLLSQIAMRNIIKL